jgi:carbon starvation protein CstA
MSVRKDGLFMPDIISEYLGDTVRKIVGCIIVVTGILVGAVFATGSADLLSSLTGVETHLLLVIIFAYFLIATLLPVDKIIGKIYPIFGIVFLIMAVVMISALLMNPHYTIPEFTTPGLYLTTKSIFPFLFVTIACGAISGFHSSQSPIVARCMENEKDMRLVFYGAMVVEGILALIWAAIAMAFWGGAEGLNNAIAENAGSAARLVNIISEATLGCYVAPLVVVGIVACAITSGDTAFRSARLIAADMFNIPQNSLFKRIAVSLPLFVLGVLIIFALPFQTIWSYFAWMNQALATITLWCITVYLHQKAKPILIGLIPAMFMTYVCSSYIFISPMMVGLENHTVAYGLGAVLVLLICTLVYLCLMRKR